MIAIIRDADGEHWVGGKPFKPRGVREYRKKTLTKAVQMPEAFWVDTLEGAMEGKAGDWLMIGVNGEMYPCDADIFDKTYERAVVGVHDVDEFYVDDADDPPSAP